MIAIITYDTPHRKTQDILFQLLIKGYKEISIIATPFADRKNHVPLLPHRPSKAVNISLKEMCHNIGVQYCPMNIEEVDNFLTNIKATHVLIAGAGILPESLVKNHKIINAHPGYLPFVKGLDALKWAIYEGLPIGVTSHFVSEAADEGFLIDRKEVPVYFEDSFYSVAYRQYEMEVEMLVDAIELSKNNSNTVELKDDNYHAHRRMSHHKERIMMERFHALTLKSDTFRKDV